MTGRIVILNGAPRAGKSSIVAAMQADLSGNWINLGVDMQNRALPPHLLPGIGLRPGGEKPELEETVRALYLALYQSIAAHARAGLDVVVDVGHHDHYSRPLGILPACAGILDGLDVHFVGVRCPVEIIMARRNADTGSLYVKGEGVPAPVQRWQDAVHVPGIYDLEIDTSAMAPEDAARAIGAALAAPRPHPTAMQRLAAMDQAR